MRRTPGPEKRIILFIDTGDNCRCPMAAGYFLKLLEQRGVKHIEIRTAGVMTPTGLLPTPEAVLLLSEEGVDIRRHRSRPLTSDMIRKADLVLGMTPFHVQSAFRMTEDARGKTYLLKEYVGRDGRNTQIADPMGGTLEIFKKCFAEIRASLQRLVEMEIVTRPPVVKEPEHVAAPKPVPVPEKPEKPEKKPAKAKKAEKAKPEKHAKPAKAAKTKKAAKASKSEKPVRKASAKRKRESAKAAKPVKAKPHKQKPAAAAKHKAKVHKPAASKPKRKK